MNVLVPSTLLYAPQEQELNFIPLWDFLNYFVYPSTMPVEDLVHLFVDDFCAQLLPLSLASY